MRKTNIFHNACFVISKLVVTPSQFYYFNNIRLFPECNFLFYANKRILVE